MNRDGNLQKILSELAHALPRDVSGQAEEDMLVVFRARRARSRRMRIYAVATAACLIAALTWFMTSPTAERVPPSDESYQAFTAGFVPTPYAESGVPIEEAVIVRVQLPRSELGRLGVPLTASAGPNGKVSADLLIGQDGITRAVRIVGN